MRENDSPLLRRLAAGAAVALIAAASLSCNMVTARANGMRADLFDWGFEEHVVQLGEDRVHYWDGGHGPPILLVHGLGGDGLWVWHTQAESLARRHRVIIPDLLWYGGSESPSQDFSIAYQRRMLVELLAELGLDHVDVVGLSYGGIIACGMVSANPGLVGRLVAIGAPCCGFTAADLQTVKHNLGDDMASLFMPTDHESLTRVLGIGYADPPYAPDFAKDDIIAAIYAPHREQKTRLLYAFMDNFETLARQSCPEDREALIIWGEHDPLFPLDMGKRFAQSLGDRARFHVVPGARHAPNLDHEEIVNPLLTGFLDPATAALPRD